MSVILRFQTSGAIPGPGDPVRMRGGSLTVGRSAENDIVLPDPVVSKRHCVIEDHGGSIVVIDLSTNGTFLNYGKMPLGRVPTPINNGDVLSVGASELVVEILSESAAQDPLDLPPLEDGPLAGPGRGDAQMPIPGTDFLDDLLGEVGPLQGPGSVQRPDLAGADGGGILPPLDLDDLLAPVSSAPGPAEPQHGDAARDAFRPPRPDPGGIPDDWDDLLAPDPPAADPPLSEPPLSEPPGADRGMSSAAPVPPAPVRDAAPAGAAQGLADFLAGADLPEARIPPEEAQAVLRRAGGVFRSLIVGIREVLMARSALKSAFRIESTMISPDGNSPLKFLPTHDEAMERMLRPTRGYMPAEEAAREALDDIKAHQVAMVTGMEAALKGVLAQLAPQVLEGRITRSGGLGGLLKGRKARYWEAYEGLYAEIAEQAESDFQELFANEFAKAYQAQLARLKAEARSRGG